MSIKKEDPESRSPTNSSSPRLNSLCLKQEPPDPNAPVVKMEPPGSNSCSPTATPVKGIKQEAKDQEAKIKRKVHFSS
jgi:hypothetical protein